MNRITLFFCIFFFSGITASYANPHVALVGASIQQRMTPNTVLHRLKVGNERFVHQQFTKINFHKTAALTAKSQHPIAIVLTCIDSRVPPEIIFDQNVGNIFVTRVAADVINRDVLAGMEYATAVSGAKLIVVLGHQSCGAIKGACEKIRLGNMTQLFAKIKPAISEATKKFGKRECNNPAFINSAAEDNVRYVMKEIPLKSSILRDLMRAGKIKIVGAMYHLRTGKVTFLKNT